MDQQNNQPSEQLSEQNIQQPTTPISTPVQPPIMSPPPTQTPNMQSTPVMPENHNKKKILIGAAVLFFIILIISLIFYATGSLNRAKELSVQPTSMLQKPTITLQPEKSQEEIEAESVDTADPSSDISELEIEASSL